MKLQRASAGSTLPLRSRGSSDRQPRRNDARRPIALAGTSTIVLPVVSELVRRTMMTATGTVAANNVATGECPRPSFPRPCDVTSCVPRAIWGMMVSNVQALLLHQVVTI